MKLRNFPALAASLSLGAVALAPFAPPNVYALSPTSSFVVDDETFDDAQPENRRNLVDLQIVDEARRDVDFSGADLTGADFSQAFFYRCNFSGATLDNVRLDEGTVFYKCNFSGATLTNISRTSPVSDIDATFVQCDFSRATLKNVDTNSADSPRLFERCVFDGARLADVDATDLTTAQIKSTANFKTLLTLEGVRFKIDERDFSGFVLSRISLQGATLLKLTDARLEDVDAIGVSGWQLESTVNFREKNYVDLRLKAANETCPALHFEKYDFSGAMLTRCRFWRACFRDADFSDAILIDCSFRGAEDLTLEQLKSTWNWKAGRLDLAFGPDALDEKLKAQVDAALAEESKNDNESQNDEELEAKRRETAAAFELALNVDETPTPTRRHVPSNFAFDAIPSFRVVEVKRTYQYQPHNRSTVTYPCDPERAVVVQGTPRRRERFVVSLTGAHSRTATLRVEYFSTSKSCREALLDRLAPNGVEPRWTRGSKTGLGDCGYFVAVQPASGGTTLLFTRQNALFEFSCNEKAESYEATNACRYIDSTYVEKNAELNAPFDETPKTRTDVAQVPQTNEREAAEAQAPDESALRPNDQKRRETAAAFQLELSDDETPSPTRRHVPTNYAFPAIPYFRVDALDWSYATPSGEVIVKRRGPETGFAVQGPQRPQEHFVVLMSGDDSRKATLRAEYFPTLKSCREALLDRLAADGDAPRWTRGDGGDLGDCGYFVASAPDGGETSLLFTRQNAVFEFTCDDKTSLDEALEVCRYLDSTYVEQNVELNRDLR
ncbi:MAG: pentapeptide repeat-containing protein [Thermoguttaceae bacterium]|nr:pentapeptide repeat-containing protein [Thermoguttaceae bacterium]